MVRAAVATVDVATVVDPRPRIGRGGAVEVVYGAEVLPVRVDADERGRLDATLNGFGRSRLP